MDGRLLRVQVKTCTRREVTKNGHERWPVLVCTNGGNQSWTGVTKYFDPSKVDVLFVLVGNGRRWVIPAEEVESRRTLNLGGTKYSEFEVDAGFPILHLVYGGPTPTLTIDRSSTSGERRSWRVGLGCKPSALVAEGVRIPPPPPQLEVAERGTAPHGQTRVSGNRQIVIPKRAFDGAGLARGDRLKAFALGPGQIVFNRVARERETPAPSPQPPAGSPAATSRPASASGPPTRSSADP
jgi:hypothetical protein